MKSLWHLTAFLVACTCAATLRAQAPPPLPPPSAVSPPNVVPPTDAKTPPSALPPPPPEFSGDPDLEPKVTIIRRDGETVEEVRVGGQLRYIKVTPRHGRPYYLVPSSDGQRFTRSDPFGPTLSAPMWELFSW